MKDSKERQSYPNRLNRSTIKTLGLRSSGFEALNMFEPHLKLGLGLILASSADVLQGWWYWEARQTCNKKLQRTLPTLQKSPRCPKIIQKSSKITQKSSKITKNATTFTSSTSSPLNRHPGPQWIRQLPSRCKLQNLESRSGGVPGAPASGRRWWNELEESDLVGGLEYYNPMFMVVNSGWYLSVFDQCWYLNI